MLSGLWFAGPEASVADLGSLWVCVISNNSDRDSQSVRQTSDSMADGGEVIPTPVGTAMSSLQGLLPRLQVSPGQCGWFRPESVSFN